MPLPTDELVRKANTTSTQLAALIPKIWAARIEQNIRKSAVLQQSIVDFNELLVPGAGDTLYVPSLPDLGAATSLSEDTDVTETALSNATSISLVPSEYGKAVAVRRKALDRIGYDGVAEVIDRLSYSMTLLIEDQIASLYNATLPLTGGGGSAPSALYPNGHATGTIVAGDTMTGVHIINGAAALKAANVPTWPDGYYHLYMHTNMWAELYADDDTRADLRYAAPGEALLNGEIARLYGVKIILSNFIKSAGEGSGGAVTTYNNLLTAPRWACVSWKRRPGMVIDPTLYDYGRKRKFGVFSDHDIELLHQDRVLVLKAA